MPARYQRLTELDGQANDPSRLGSRIRRSRGGWFMRHLEALARRPSRMITLAIGAFLIIFLTTWLGFTRSGHDAARDWVSSASEQAGSWISGAAKLDKGGENGAQSATNTKAGPTTPGLNPWTIGGPPKPVYEKVKGGEISPAEAVFDFTPGAPPVTVEEMAQWGSKADNGLLYPPNFIPALSNKSPRAKAGFIVLVRNAELHSMQESMREVESRFNSKYGYPWIFLNDADFTDEFKAGVRKFTRSETRFGKVPVEHWSYPPWINQTKAAEARKNMKGILYGSSETYRHMCRFQTGFFYRHPLTQDLDYYWRVEPGIKLHCHLDYDPFLFMQMNNKTYGFTMALHEYLGTVPTLWQEARDFIEKHPQFLAKDHGLHFMTDEPDKLMEPGWNLCECPNHFRSSLNVADAPCTLLGRCRPLLGQF